MTVFSGAKARLLIKIIVHSALLICFISILLSSDHDIAVHTKLPYVLGIIWLLHFYLNKQYFVAFFKGKIKGWEVLLKVIVSICLFAMLLCTATFGFIFLSGSTVPLISHDLAYEYHGVLATISLVLLLIHLWQNRKIIMLIKRNFFSPKKNDS